MTNKIEHQETKDQAIKILDGRGTVKAINALVDSGDRKTLAAIENELVHRIKTIRKSGDGVVLDKKGNVIGTKPTQEINTNKAIDESWIEQALAGTLHAEDCSCLAKQAIVNTLNSQISLEESNAISSVTGAALKTMEELIGSVEYIRCRIKMLLAIVRYLVAGRE